MTIERRVREIISPSIDEWIGQKIDTAELERRKELARQQAVAEDTLADSGDGTAAAALQGPQGGGPSSRSLQTALATWPPTTSPRYQLVQRYGRGGTRPAVGDHAASCRPVRLWRSQRRAYSSPPGGSHSPQGAATVQPRQPWSRRRRARQPYKQPVSRAFSKRRVLRGEDCLTIFLTPYSNPNQQVAGRGRLVSAVAAKGHAP